MRPWWWIINPWLYAIRRDRAYADALETLREITIENWRLRHPKPEHESELYPFEEPTP